MKRQARSLWNVELIHPGHVFLRMVKTNILFSMFLMFRYTATGGAATSASVKVVAGGQKYPTWNKYFESNTAPGGQRWPVAAVDAPMDLGFLGNECCQPVDPAVFHDRDQKCQRYKPALFTSRPRHRKLTDDLSKNLRGERSVCLSFCGTVRSNAEVNTRNPDWPTKGIGYVLYMLYSWWNTSSFLMFL
jgi:hypothetical protein